MRESTSPVPAPRVRLIGREFELSHVRRQLVHGYERLVTLTGPGGAGKTSLALELVRMLPEISEGIWFVDLGSIDAPEAIVQACCDAIGLVDTASPPLETLAEYLAPRAALVVLDNCEHVAAGAASLVDHLLDRCPDLRILATSRTPLRVRSEAVFVVPPLALPAADASDPVDLASVPSVALFAERAGAADPAFRLTDEATAAVVAICRRVDGLPLAIELAAAQVAALSVVEIEAQLARAPGLPRIGQRRGPARQRTMEATFDWSYTLLTPDERTLFRRLAVFAGGWTLEAAEQVCGDDSLDSTVPALLVRLVEQSLVVHETSNSATRFRFLAPVAEYAGRRLDVAGERNLISLPHAQYYLGLAARRVSGTVYAAPEDLELVAAEYENLSAALVWAERAAVLPLVVGLCTAMLEFWRVRGYLRTGAARLEAAASLLAGERSRGHAVVLTALANFRQLLGEPGASIEAARESLTIWQELEDPRGIRTAHGVLGDIAAYEGDYDRARAEYQRAWEYLGDGDRIGRGFWFANVGSIALHEDALDEAEARLEQARVEFGQASTTWYLGRVLCQLGAIARQRDDPHRASRLLGEGLRWLHRYGARVEAVVCLEEFGRVAIQRRAPARAVTLFAAAAHHRQAMALGGGTDEGVAVRDLDAARARLSIRSYEIAWSRGWAMSLDEAVAFASENTAEDGGASAGVASRGVASRGVAGRTVAIETLTARERQIARLVASGLTNPQIAEQLRISTGTARIHVERILHKLGLASRVQIATWVVTDPEEETARP